MTVPAPHLYERPSVLIGTVEVECMIQMVTLVPEVPWVDIETYCNPGGERPGRVSWRGVLRVRMSYGTGSAWELFSANGGQEVEMTIMPAEATAPSTDVPEATFDAYLGVLPFIPDHEVGASATFDLEFRVIGEPTFSYSA
ncbi:MAG TPA: hypothetical protein VGK49_04495 [Ilumatobacteraceae bacterium]